MKSTATSPPSRSMRSQGLVLSWVEDLVVAGLRVVQVSIGVCYTGLSREWDIGVCFRVLVVSDIYTLPSPKPP